MPDGVRAVTVRYSAGELLRWVTGLGGAGWVLVVCAGVLVPGSDATARVAGRWGRRDQAMVGRSTHA